MRISIGIAAIALAGSLQAVANVPAATAQTALSNATTQTDSRFDKFRPKSKTINTRIDFTSWDEALDYFVFDMGPSIRESAPSVDPGLGTRRVYGHESRYRLEGNRVIFSYLEDDVKAALTAYRTDLEQTAASVDIASLPRNEQLAFWINLHNVAVIEQIALAYPVSQPSRISVNGSKLPFDETPFLTVAGVSMSPKDIRTKIVYPNWTDPKVIYGFFRGEIGGPSIQRDAFSGDDVADLLDQSASEFINSLRGAQKNGRYMDVSDIYEEARPFFFRNWEADIRQHLLTYSREPITRQIEEAEEIRPNIYETAISDLANGERDPSYGFVVQGEGVKGFKVASNVARLLGEKAQKTEKINKRSDIEGRVTIIDVGDLFDAEKPKKSDSDEVD